MDNQNKNGNFEQDLSDQGDMPGAVFIIKLLFKNEPSLPDKDKMTEIMTRHAGEVDCFWHDEKGAGFAPKKYVAHFKDADVPPQLMINAGSPFDGTEMDDFCRSQMWDCRDQRDRILSECKHQVIAVDMLAAGLEPAERANMDMDFLEALVEMYPDCEAVYIYNSGKLILADEIRNSQLTGNDRFIKFAVNVRFFNIQGTEDMLIDTLGMSVLFMPDLQYHFHGMDPNWVVNHAYCTASYILDNNNPIKSGDPIDGINNGRISMSVQWKTQYESALIQPVREVIDVCMNWYASGRRG